MADKVRYVKGNPIVHWNGDDGLIAWLEHESMICCDDVLWRCAIMRNTQRPTWLLHALRSGRFHQALVAVETDQMDRTDMSKGDGPR